MDLFGDDVIEEIEEDDDEEIIEEFVDTESFKHPREMNFLLGHADIEKNLLDLYNPGRMPHALVFTGPQGIGKATMAYRFARFLLKNGLKDNNQSSMFGEAPPTTSLDVPVEGQAFRRVANNAHPDLFTTIGIDFTVPMATVTLPTVSFSFRIFLFSKFLRPQSRNFAASAARSFISFSPFTTKTTRLPLSAETPEPIRPYPAASVWPVLMPSPPLLR